MLTEEHRRRQRVVDELLRGEVRGDDVTIVDLARALCVDARCEVGNREGSFYAGSSHLSIEGAMEARPVVREVFEGFR
jgi:hypothetical protein